MFDVRDVSLYLFRLRPLFPTKFPVIGDTSFISSECESPLAIKSSANLTRFTFRFLRQERKCLLHFFFQPI